MTCATCTRKSSSTTAASRGIFAGLEDADRTARGDNPMCGDRLELFLKLGSDGSD